MVDFGFEVFRTIHLLMLFFHRKLRYAFRPHHIFQSFARLLKGLFMSQSVICPLINVLLFWMCGSKCYLSGLCTLCLGFDTRLIVNATIQGLLLKIVRLAFFLCLLILLSEILFKFLL